jgi:hypothetical protein
MDGAPTDGTSPDAAWHTLLAPLPAGATVQRAPIAPPGAEAIAGWEQLTVGLSAGAAGRRQLLVLLDAAGTVLSASDAVVRTTAGTVSWHHASIGGRFEPDGRFLGTCWRGVGTATDDADEPTIASVPSPPSDAEVAALRALVDEIVRRAPPRAPHAR